MLPLSLIRYVALSFKESSKARMSPSDAVIGWTDADTGDSHVGGYRLQVAFRLCSGFLPPLPSPPLDPLSPPLPSSPLPSPPSLIPSPITSPSLHLTPSAPLPSSLPFPLLFLLWNSG